jgi:hypothetical protein
LSIKDKEIINDIHFKLNSIGKKYEYSNRQEVHLAITKLKDLKWLIVNIFNHFPLLTKHQRERFSRLKYGVENSINRVNNFQEYTEYIDKTYALPLTLNFNKPIIVNAFDNWLSGFINGEGSFVINPKGILIFYIEQAENEVLNLIKKRLDLSPKIFYRVKRNENRKDTYSLAISSKKDIRTLVNFFENNSLISLQGNKKKQYEIWIKHYYSCGKYDL